MTYVRILRQYKQYEISILPTAIMIDEVTLYDTQGRKLMFVQQELQRLNVELVTAGLFNRNHQEKNNISL
ncbi:MAG TPA: hypothetical protein VF581_06500 [Flavobacterium sp.]|jgi:hypothetical protein